MPLLSRRNLLFGGAAVGAGVVLTGCTSNDPQNTAQVKTGTSDDPNAAAGPKVIIGFSAPAADHGWIRAITDNARKQAALYKDVKLTQVDAGADAPAQIICEGVAVYLDPAVLEGLLTELRAVATPGTRLALSTSVSLPAGDQGPRERFAASVQAAGEPARNAMTAESADELLKAKDRSNASRALS